MSGACGQVAKNTVPAAAPSREGLAMSVAHISGVIYRGLFCAGEQALGTCSWVGMKDGLLVGHQMGLPLPWSPQVTLL